MRQKGIIHQWNDVKGFGFITSGQDNTTYFFHINAFRNRGRRPAVNTAVVFAAGTDKQGRKQALNVRPAGTAIAHPAVGAGLISALFLSGVSGAALAGLLPGAVMWLYLGASGWAFLQYFMDKSAAQKGAQRTPETTLHMIALTGGWPGALLAQQLLRHKSRKTAFRRTFALTVAINIGALIYLLSPYGSWLADKINVLAG